MGRSLAGKRERGHFRSREVTPGRGTSRRKGPGEGRAGKRQRGAGKIALLLRSLALRRQWGDISGRFQARGSMEPIVSPSSPWRTDWKGKTGSEETEKYQNSK